MEDYLLGWDLPLGVGPERRTMRVKMTPLQAMKTERILRGLMDDGAIRSYFIETVPERSASFEQFVERAGKPLSSALKWM